jgi:RNA polymerase sigma-70 factor, ECF subfamily
MEDFDDDRIVELVKAGDSRAFSLLVRRHNGAVLGLCMRMYAGNKALSEEMCQEAWLRVFRNIDAYVPKGQFRAWLKTITRNLVLNSFRKKQEFLAYTDEELEAETSDPDALNAEDSLFEIEKTENLKKAIDSLPENQRVAMVLWLDDLPNEEIGREMGLSLSSVKSILFRARENLRTVLQEKKNE